MATSPYGGGIGVTTGTISDGLTRAQVDGSVEPTVGQALLDSALAKFDGGNPNLPIFELNSDTIGGAQTVTSQDSFIPVFFAGSANATTLQLAGSHVQLVLGGSSALTVTGSNATNGPQTMVGGAGAVNFSAGTQGGAHLLEGGSGGSTLTGGSGADTLLGGLYATSHDTLIAGTGANVLSVTMGNNQLFTHTGTNDTLSAGSGNDTLWGSSSKADHTTYNVGQGSSNATVNGGAGKDDVIVAQSGTGKIFVEGDFGKNSVTFVGESKGDAHVHTNDHTGITKVTFDSSEHVVKLHDVQTIHFGAGGSTHLDT